MKKTFKKLFALLLSLTVVLAFFAGCDKKVADKDEDGRTIISVGGWPTKEGPSLDKMNNRKDAFEKNNPDVKIIPDSFGFDLQTFYSKAAGGQIPDVYGSMFTEISEIAKSGYAADLTDVLKENGYDNMINESILDLITVDGKIYAYPTAAYLTGLNCNIELFEEAGLMNPDGTPMQPKTWDEVREFAVKIKEKTGKAGFMIGTASNIGGFNFTPIAWSFGAKFMEKNSDGKWIATFDSPETVAALQWVKDLKWKYDVLPANAIIDFNEGHKLFGTGQVGMRIRGDSAYLVQYGTDPEMVGALAMPAGPKRHVTLLGGSVKYISANSTKDQIDAALRWIKGESDYELTDDLKTNEENTLKEKLANNEHIGTKAFSPWSIDSPVVKFKNELIDKYANANINHCKPYNDFVAECNIEIQPEEPMCAQQLYAILDGCIQSVLTDKNADCALLIKKAAEDFQKNYLDNVN